MNPQLIPERGDSETDAEYIERLKLAVLVSKNDALNGDIEAMIWRDIASSSQEMLKRRRRGLFSLGL